MGMESLDFICGIIKSKEGDINNKYKQNIRLLFITMYESSCN